MGSACHKAYKAGKCGTAVNVLLSKDLSAVPVQVILDPHPFFLPAKQGCHDQEDCIEQMETPPLSHTC